MQFQGEITVNSKFYVEKHLALSSVVRCFPDIDIDNCSQKQQRIEEKSDKRNEESRLYVFRVAELFPFKGSLRLTLFFIFELLF